MALATAKLQRSEDGSTATSDRPTNPLYIPIRVSKCALNGDATTHGLPPRTTRQGAPFLDKPVVGGNNLHIREWVQYMEIIAFF